jgi:hypothetical protein
VAVEQTSGFLDNLDTAASALQSVATTVALGVGAIWAYFKFIKDRVYRPRVEVSIQTDTLTFENHENMVCRLALKNIGTSKVELIQKGTGLRLTRGERGSEPYRQPLWGASNVFEIFPEHQWIESGETIRHELSVALPANRAEVLMLTLRLICSHRSKRIEFNSRAIVPPGSPSKEVIGSGNQARK